MTHNHAKTRPRFWLVRAILDAETGQYLTFHTSSKAMVQEIADDFNRNPRQARDWGWIPKKRVTAKK